MKRILILIALLLSSNDQSFAGGLAEPSGEAISARLRSFVATELEVDASEIEISRADPINGQKHFLPGKILSIRPTTRGNLLGRGVFIFSMTDGQGRDFSQWIRADIEQVREVVVARKVLRRHQIINRDDLEIEKIRIRRQKNRYESNVENLIGKRLIRQLQKGQPLFARFVEETPLIRRGEQVTITLQAGGLQIITLGKAKEDGKLGEVIKVMNLDSRKVVFAEVIRQGDVRVGFAN